MEYPKIYLALDNCFALKRWVEPETWLPLIKDLGYTSIQASYDNEFDMLYNTKEYIDSWLERLTVAEKQYGAKVQSFYSGYQTYRTSGLAHPDRRVVNSIVEGWIKPAVKIAGERNADMGFALHGIPENIMQDPEKYRECHEKLYRIYSDIGEYARKNGQVHVCVEAMYSPHHTPWTIEGTKEFLKNIYSLDGNAIYTTVDIGHMTGQHKFRKPEKEAIEKSLFNHPIKGYCPLWLGSDSAYAIWDDAAAGKLDKKQAVINIIKNAFEAMHESGTTDIHVFYEEPWMSIAVIDHGGGLDPALADTIFQPFITSKTGGSGLGLVITRQIIESHHGTLTCDSRPGDGCTFTITLPLTQN